MGGRGEFSFFPLLPEFVYDVLHYQESREEVHLRKEGQTERQRDGERREEKRVEVTSLVNL